MPSARPRGTTSVMAGRLGQGDLLAGGIAVALLLLLVLAFDVPPLIAIPIAVATYVGAVLIRPQVASAPGETIDEVQLSYQAALAHLASIRVQESRVADPGVRDQVGRIADTSERILAAMVEDRNMAAAPLFNDQLLEPVDALLIEYVRLTTRGVKSADDLILKVETHDLPMIERATTIFHEKLHRENVVDLATLGDVLELNIERISTSRLRRSSP